MFSIRHAHRGLKIFSFSTVERTTGQTCTERLDNDAWVEIEGWRKNWRLWEYMHESRMTKCDSDLNTWLNDRCDFGDSDPLTRLEQLVQYLNEEF